MNLCSAKTTLNVHERIKFCGIYLKNTRREPDRNEVMNIQVRPNDDEFA